MSSPGPNKRLAAVHQQMSERFTEQLLTADLAAAAGMSTFQFIRAFKAAYGITPRGYIIWLRMERARHLLVTTTFQIQEICRLCGYISHGSFTDQFRRVVGMPPTEYRQRFQRK